jgi:murein DD-endopeptidase MepM/ murein hydrolase activator NlpD
MKWLVVLRIASSFKTEVKIVLLTLAFLLLLPAFAVVAVAQSGTVVVSKALAALNPVTHKVEVRNPNGGIVTELNATTVWPVCGYISEEFGVPHLPWQEHHTGIDIANPSGQIGDPVTPFMEGEVILIDVSERSGYGKYAVVDHGHTVTSLYAHLSAVSVQVGDNVRPGDVIGLEGNTGSSTGPHLHLEIKVTGVPVEPRTFMVGEPQECTA